MPGLNGTGPRGMGPMTGGGRGFCNPRGAVPRQGAFRRYGPYGVYPIVSSEARPQDIEALKDQAEALKNELKRLEAEIERLSAEKA